MKSNWNVWILAATLVLTGCGGGDGWDGIDTTPDGYSLYGADGKTGFPGYLYGIDPTTGNLTQIGLIGYAITGMVMLPDGYLYGTESTQGGDVQPSRLIKIDPATGEGTVVGQLLEGGVTEHNSIAGLTYAASTLIGWSENGDQPVTIDPATGAVTVIGGGTGSAGSGMATNSGGTIYVAPEGESGTLYTVDPGTGVVTAGPTLNGSTGNTTELNALAFLNGTLYALCNDDDDFALSALELYTVDPVTGLMTLVKEYPFERDSGRTMDAIAAGGTP